MRVGEWDLSDQDNYSDELQVGRDVVPSLYLTKILPSRLTMLWPILTSVQMVSTVTWPFLLLRDLSHFLSEFQRDLKTEC